MGKNDFVKSQLLKFADKYLDGKLENLATFRVVTLQEDKQFGSPGRRFDPDDTNLMRLIYMALFSEAWPDMTWESLEKQVFRGDTLNTYNTMYGRPNDKSMHPGLDRYNPPEELKNKVANYDTNIYSRIGNFMVLPNIPYLNQTINTYRGCHTQWRDFTDRFLVALHEVLVGKNECDNGLSDLVETNAKFFRTYRTSDGIKELAHYLLLNDYLGEDGFPQVTSKSFYYWKRAMKREDYLAEAERYIDFAAAVINHRTQLMIDGLKLYLDN